MKTSLGLIFLILSLQVMASPYISTNSVEVCTIPLPVTSHIVINRMIFNTKHIYLKIDNVTYGTPFTIDKTYLGGEAHLYTEDPFFKKFKGEGEKCYPTSYHFTDTEADYKNRLSCIARKMAIEDDEDLTLRDWYPIFDYHALKNNCGSMARFVVDCAKGEFTKVINYSVGDKVEDSKEASIVIQSEEGAEKRPSNYGDICQLALDECDFDESLKI